MKIGFIGLGIMGKPMAKNLLKNGYELVVCDIVRDAVDELVKQGASSAATPAEAAAGVPLVITMLPNSPQVETVLLGENGVLSSAEPGLTVIDMSSIDPQVSRRLGSELAKSGVDMLDAPVSGGEPKAIDGTLSIMVGGKAGLFSKFESVLRSMGASVVLVGELGAGNVAKLSNQIIVALNIAAVAEGLMLAKKLDVDPEKVYQAVRGGLAGSTVLDAKAPMMLNNNFKPGFRINLHIKDLNNALAAGDSVDMPLPLAHIVLDMFKDVAAAGGEACDHSGLLKYYEKLAGTAFTDK